MTIFDKLYVARMSLGLNQRQIQEHCGVKQPTLSALEKGKKKLIPSRYIQFLQQKGIDPNWLFSEDESGVRLLSRL